MGEPKEMPDDDKDAYGDSRNRLLDFIQQHEQDKHGGFTCMEERVNAVAFIAHSLGMAADDDDAWEFIRTIVKLVYEASHHPT